MCCCIFYFSFPVCALTILGLELLPENLSHTTYSPTVFFFFVAVVVGYLTRLCLLFLIMILLSVPCIFFPYPIFSMNLHARSFFFLLAHM